MTIALDADRPTRLRMPDRLGERDDLLVVEGVTKSFGPRRGVLSSRRRTPTPPVVALDDVSFRVGRTEVLGSSVNPGAESRRSPAA